MNTTNHIRRIVRVTALALLLPVLLGCIKEDMSNCYTGERVLVVQVVDAATGEDMTASGEVSGAELFVFDADGKYTRISMDSDQIARSQRIPLGPGDGRNVIVSVWGNAGEGQNLNAPGSRGPESQAITLLARQDGYCDAPDDLFFGIRSIASAATGSTRTETVVIMRKNARMNITARGLSAEEGSGSYYFVVNKPVNGYDFEGRPTRSAAMLRRPGVFDGRNDLVTPAPFNLIHTDPADAASKNDAVRVDLYKSPLIRASDQLIASVTEDSDGHPIVLRRAETTNVLIDLSQTGDLQVRIEITPWDEIYQWEIW